MPFSGFPPRVRFTAVPNPIFGQLLEEIDDIAELKCTLRIIWLVNQKKGLPRGVTLEELLADQTLANALKGRYSDIPKALKDSLAKAVSRGTLIHVTSVDGEADVYLLNIDSERRALEMQKKLTIQHEPLPQAEAWQAVRDRPNIFALYESNIGMLTPLIAEQLKEAETLYPSDWIEDAFREAVTRNKRSWRYIARILQRWEQEGRDDGEHGGPWGHIKKADPKKYLRL